MPLCPQITNTPITVTQTADFTVTSIVPLIADSFDGLANNFESIEILADGKTKVYRANDEPTGAEINNGDLWIDLNDGNKLYVRAGGVWTSAQDGSIATAQSTANSASSAAAAAAAEAAAANAAAVAAQSTANSAATAAGAAQSTANTALANAATAFTTAQNSLQPSAYAIQNPTTKQLTSIDATGLTVYSGASATSGARVVLNSAGLAGFNSGGTATFSISASTGAAVFSGSVTGSTITGGTLNIGGNAIIDATGLLTATGATITGTINAKAGYFGTPTNGFSISSTGLVGVGTGTIVGGTIQGATFTNGSTFSVTSAGVLTATSGTIGGVSLSASALTGGTIQTSSGSNAVILNGSSNAMQIKANGSVVTNMLNFSTSGALWHYGSSPDSSGASYPKVQLSSSSASIDASSTQYLAAGSNNNSIVGQTTYSGGTHTFSNTLTASSTFNANSDVFMPNLTTTTSAANMRVGTGAAGEVFESTASSQRFKENIVGLDSVFDLDPKKLLNLPVRAFTYKEGYLSANDDRFDIMLPGFIAEEVDAIYPVATDYGQDGPHSWNERFIIPGLLALIQDLYKEIKLLKGE
jgi:hypothetical protein